MTKYLLIVVLISILAIVLAWIYHFSLLPSFSKIPNLNITTEHMVDGPIIFTEMDSLLIEEEEINGYRNINGPCLIKVPKWVENPLGKYYLYFAHHKGDRIKLAVAYTGGGEQNIGIRKLKL